MSIVLRENDWAKQKIQDKTLGKKPSETLRRVARKYIDDGYPKKDVRKMVEIFLLQCEPDVSLPKWSEAIDYAIGRAYKYPAICIDCINITKSEMNKIDALSGKQIKRLAFTLLCLAKYWAIVAPETDFWVNNKDNEVMALANINTSIKRQSMMYHTLHELGMIQFSKKVDNTSVRVCFVDDSEDIALSIHDLRNLGYQYLMFHGEPYMECQRCGCVTKIENPTGAGRKQKYCKSCATEVRVQQAVNSAMRIREKYRAAHNDSLAYTVYMHEFPNGKVYIGVTGQTLYERWKNGKGYNGTSVGDAINTFGWENVKHYVLFECCDKKTAKQVEACAIKQKNANLEDYGYNTGHTPQLNVDEAEIPEYQCVEVDEKGAIKIKR